MTMSFGQGPELIAGSDNEHTDQKLGNDAQYDRGADMAGSLISIKDIQ